MTKTTSKECSTCKAARYNMKRTRILAALKARVRLSRFIVAITSSNLPLLPTVELKVSKNKKHSMSTLSSGVTELTPRSRTKSLRCKNLSTQMSYPTSASSLFKIR